MSDGVVAAIVAALGGIVVAIIGLYGRKPSTPEAPRPTPADLPPVAEIEQALRQDLRVQRLVGHKGLRDAAEAAIAYLCRGVACPVENWRRSATWQQVAAVHAELVGSQRHAEPGAAADGGGR